MKELLHHALLKRVLQKRLAPFFIVAQAPSLWERPDVAQQWMKHFIQSYLQEVRPHPHPLFPHDHPDILWCTSQKADEEHKSYLVEDFDIVFNFLHFKAFELPWRFIIVPHAHLVGETLANKLLKSLEQPGPEVSIFFINESGKALLPTIESRAIHLRIRQDLGIHESQKLSHFGPLMITPELKKSWWQRREGLGQNLRKHVISYLDNPQQQFSIFWEMLKKSHPLQLEFMKHLIDWQRETVPSEEDQWGESKGLFLEILRHFQQSIEEYGNAGERAYQLIYALDHP